MYTLSISPRRCGFRSISTLLAALLMFVMLQGEGMAQPGVNREKMWPAPTADDWAKPCLITWQRTWADAQAVSKETEKPILICVNMDGEIASEHYAGIRYRMPEITKLYEPYITVIASVYRHTPRDFDEEGKRIECPRFGQVTCGEHIAIEPGLYEKYFDGERVAPRHVMVELDGNETYDVYYAFDTDSVFQAIADGITNRGITPPIVVRGDRPILERVASHDSRDRTAVEKAYLEGDQELRKALLDAALKHGDIASVDLLRLGIFGFDAELSKLSRKALARSKSDAAIDLIPDALAVPMPDSEREELLAALKKLGESSTASERAQWLSVVHQGLSTSSEAVNTQGWSAALKGATYPSPEDTNWMTIESKLKNKSEASGSSPKDPKALLELAEASLAYALEADHALGVTPKTDQLLTADPATAKRLARSKYHEARQAALEAKSLGENSWRLDAVLSLIDYYQGNNLTEAYALAEKAMKAMPTGVTEWNSMAVLTVFAEGRFRGIKKAISEKRKWPPEWLTDVHSAYSVLLHHPLGTDNQVQWHYDFLMWLGAHRRATRFLDEGIKRFPNSWILHDRLRGRLLQVRKIEDLETTYASMLRRSDDPSTIRWFAGLASFVAAEFHRKIGSREKAFDAYGRSINYYEKVIEESPDTRETADPYIALALAGRSRIRFEAQDYETALEALLLSFDRGPDVAATLDGLNISPVDTAKMLRARLSEMKRDDLVAQLQTALDNLDPSMLELPAYEQRVPRRGQ